MILNELQVIYMILLLRNAFMASVVFVSVGSQDSDERRIQIKHYMHSMIRSGIVIFCIYSLDLLQQQINDHFAAIPWLLTLSHIVVLYACTKVLSDLTQFDDLQSKIHPIASLLLIVSTLFQQKLFFGSSIHDVLIKITHGSESASVMVQDAQILLSVLIHVVMALFMLYIIAEVSLKFLRIITIMVQNESEKSPTASQDVAREDTDFDAYFEAKMRKSQGPFWRDITKKLRWDIEQRKWVWKDPEE